MWTDQGIIACHKFVQKFWSLHQKIIKKSTYTKESEEDIKLNRFTNQTINKINISLEKFSYNTIIASLHEIYNFYNRLTDKDLESKNLLDNYGKILRIMTPIVPHIALECLSEISNKINLNWPEVNKEFLEKDSNKIIIQINGKMREILTSSKNYSENEIITEIQKMPKIKKFLIDKELKKVVYIKNKLINLIL